MRKLKKNNNKPNPTARTHKNRVYIEISSGKVGKPHRWPYGIYDALYCQRYPRQFIFLNLYDVAGVRSQLTKNGWDIYKGENIVRRVTLSEEQLANRMTYYLTQ